MKKALRIVVTLCALVALTLMARAEKLNPKRVKELCATLDLERPELAEIKNAKTTEEQAEAIAKYFRTRKADNGFKVSSNKKLRENGENALKHRFIGQPSYGYVDRDKNGDIEWDDPHVPDQEWLWQFHRFSWMRGLAACYCKTKDDRYTQEWILEINSWINHMFGKYDPKGVKKGKRHPAWRSLETSGRIGAWIDPFRVFVRRPEVDTATIVNVLWALDRHVQIIEKEYSDVFTRSFVWNFDVMQQERLMRFYIAFPEFKDSQKSLETVVERMKHIEKCVLMPDGVLNEFCPAYQAGHPNTFARLKQDCQRYGIKADFGKEYDDLIQKAYTAIMLWCHPDGSYPLFGDTHTARSLKGIMEVAYKNYPERKDFLYAASLGKKGEAPKERLHRLDYGGYYTMRSEWGPTARVCCIIKNSNDPKKMWHNQPDNMTFELSFDGKRVMLDTGCYSYMANEGRHDFTPSWRHQTVTLNKKDNNRAGKCLWQKSFPDLDVTVLKNDSHKNMCHKRAVFMVENRFLVVLDRVNGAAEGELRCHWQLREGDYKFSATQATASNADIVICGSTDNGKFEEEDGMISYVYKSKTKRPAFAFVQKKKAGRNNEYLTLIAPTNIATAPMIQRNGGKICFQLANDKKYEIIYNEVSGVATLIKK